MNAANKLTTVIIDDADLLKQQWNSILDSTVVIPNLVNVDIDFKSYKL